MSKEMQRQDALVAADLRLGHSPITMVLKHATRFPDKVDGFVFAFEQGGLVHYDIVDVWRSVNGMRVRIPRFRSQPVIEERLRRRQYNRWYVIGNGYLFPVQTAKVEDLKDQFYFLTDSDPTYRTTTILTEECKFIRKKPLVQCRVQRPGWGIVFKWSKHEHQIQQPA
ncbi:hypothetical protein [Pseudomonas phage D6]|nr:hypothetical protein [Pseudomonas phage D6]